MAAAIARGDFTPVESVRAHLKQIERMQPRLNPFVAVFAEAAISRAKATLSGPLAGVPISIKDSFDIAGQPARCGSRFYLSRKSNESATVVRRLEAAGAIVIGKTNCPEFLMNYETDNHLFGRTNNPWNPEWTAGGSSGGESAAIASFCSAGGIGSDGGGSVREPANFCGIAGLKPTPGRVSAAGHLPEIAHPGGLLGVAGPMARTVSGVNLLFRVTAGYDAADPFSAPVPLREPAANVRIGVVDHWRVEPGLAMALTRATSLLETAGFETVAFDSGGLDRASELWEFFFIRLAAPFLRVLISGREQDVHWTGVELIDRVRELPEPSATAVVEALIERDRLRAAILHRMVETPILLAPGGAVAAFPHRQRTFDLVEAMAPFTVWNLLGFPALAVPILVEGGRPAGIQLIGRPYDEETLLAVGMALESARGSFPAPPCAAGN